MTTARRIEAFSDPVTATIEHLDACLPQLAPGILVLGDVPRERPTRFVRVMSSGARMRNICERDARITVECWAETDLDADALGESVYTALLEFDTPFAWVPMGAAGWVGGPYPQPDPISGTPRSVMTVIVRQARQD